MKFKEHLTKFKDSLVQFKDNIYKKILILLAFISRSIPEIFVIGGLFFIAFATFKINILAGFYCLGGILLGSGLLLAKSRDER